MNDVIINGIVNDLNIKKESVVATLKLLEEGNTVPFIARYRKEVTGALNEEEIRSKTDHYQKEMEHFATTLMKVSQNIQEVDAQGAVGFSKLM